MPITVSCRKCNLILFETENISDVAPKKLHDKVGFFCSECRNKFLERARFKDMGSKTYG